MWRPYKPAGRGCPSTLTSWDTRKTVFSLAPARHGHWSPHVPKPRLAMPYGTSCPQILPVRSVPSGLVTLGALYVMLTSTRPIHCDTEAFSFLPSGGRVTICADATMCTATRAAVSTPAVHQHFLFIVLLLSEAPTCTSLGTAGFGGRRNRIRLQRGVGVGTGAAG